MDEDALIERIKARLQRTNASAQAFTEALGLPPEAKYKIISRMALGDRPVLAAEEIIGQKVQPIFDEIVRNYAEARGDDPKYYYLELSVSSELSVQIRANKASGDAAVKAIGRALSSKVDLDVEVFTDDKHQIYNDGTLKKSSTRIVVRQDGKGIFNSFAQGVNFGMYRGYSKDGRPRYSHGFSPRDDQRSDDQAPDEDPPQPRDSTKPEESQDTESPRRTRHSYGYRPPQGFRPSTNIEPAIGASSGSFSDVILVCTSCGTTFVWPAAEQEFYTRKGFVPPRHCKECRAARRDAPPIP